MSAEYAPGTAAVATVRGVPDVRVMAGHGTAEPRLRWLTTDARLVDADNDGWYFDYQATDVRPLVVLDLSDEPMPDDTNKRNEAQALIGMLRETADEFFTPDAAALARKVADQIEAQTKPAKPAEPTGLGAVVEDAEGRKFIRYAASLAPWIGCADNEGIDPDRPYRYWSGIDAVRVLSEGVTQ